MIDLSLLQDFIAESEEHLEEMEAGLLKLESDPEEQGSFNDVFRAAHSIKGSAEYIGAEKTALLSHKLENLLEAVRQGKKTLNDNIINALMDARDRLLVLIEDLNNDKEEKTDIADIMERIENLSADNDEFEDDRPGDISLEKNESYTNEGEDEIIELTDLAAEPFGDDIITEPVNAVDEPCQKVDDEIVELTDIADDSFCKDINITPHPLFGDGETGMHSKTEEHVTYEDDNDEELFDIFLEHLKENIFSIKGLSAKLPGSDNSCDLLIKYTNAILSLKSSANYMDFMKLVDVYEEWLSRVEKFQEEMFLTDGIEFEDFFKSVKKYLDQIAAFFPSHNELCLDFDILDHESIGAGTKEAEIKPPGNPVDTPTGLEFENVEGEDMPGEVKVEHEFFNEEPDEEQVDSTVDVFTGISEEDCRQEEMEEACSLFDEPNFILLKNIKQSEGDEFKPKFFNKEFETKLLDYKESAPVDVDEETYLTPLSEALVVSKAIAQRVDNVAASEKNLPVADQDDFVQDLQPESEPKPESVKQAAAKREFTETKIIKQSVRVDAVKIDALMNQAGELVVSRAGFSQLLNEMKELQQELNDNIGIDHKEFKRFKDLTFRLGEATATLGRVANELQEGIMKVRMLPISQLFNRYPRLVRDLVHDINKKVRLEITGEETELDKMVIQEIADPIVHIIRNAVDHGIETVSERLKAGKSEEGVLTLTSYHESNHVVVEITDDGRGINPELIKEVALKKGLFTAKELERMTVKDLIGILMVPGFSTAEKISKTSGRGVGMDVVKQNIEKLNGTIEIDSEPGSGSRLRIKIPLTLAIIKALMIRVGKDIFTIPLAAVEETLQILSSDITIIEGVEVIQLRDSILSLLRLSKLFGLDAAAQVRDKEFVVVINTGMRQVGLVVDALLGQEEVVIKPLADYLQDNSGFSGATILGDGSISLILDVYELINISMDIQAARKERLKYSGAPINSFEQFSVENYEEHTIH